MKTFFLRKMFVSPDTPIQYAFHVNHKKISVNSFLQKHLSITFLNEIHCIQCDRKISNSFQQGYCFVCFQKINECNNCMIHPERCLVEAGKCDPNDWAHAPCHQKHIVYLANASGLKVGVTRWQNVPTRWIDQGARQALAIFQTNNRYQAGLLEVVLKQFVSDKTNWRAMLSQDVPLLDLFSERKLLLQKAKTKITSLLKQYPAEITALKDQKIIQFEYPVLRYLQKITALSLDKTPNIAGELLGIKGQYLLLDSGVLNMRKFGGYCVTLFAE